MQFDVNRLVRRATEPLAAQVSELAAQLAIALETIDAQKALIAELQEPAEEVAP